MIAIIDYGAGNLKSVEKAINFLGEDTVITRDKDEILSADKVILPGVGNFGDCMEKINECNLKNTIYDVVDKKTPFLGICLGLQLLFNESDEAKGVAGLGILDGKIKKFDSDMGLKIPHIGWNSLELLNNGRLFNGVKDNSFVYFVHSYYLDAKDKDIVRAKSDYGIKFEASIEKDNVFACQFHPEKSGETGLKILKNFIEL